MSGKVIGLLENCLRLETGGASVSEDALWLAASVPACSDGSKILDVGCGVGPCALALALRFPLCSVTGLEIDPETAEVARRNAERNALPVQVLCGDIFASPLSDRYDVVVCNPPFYVEEMHVPPSQEARRRARAVQVTDVSRWLEALAALVSLEGSLKMVVHDQWRDPLRRWLAVRGGVMEVLPLQSSPKRSPKRLLVGWRRSSGIAVLQEGAAVAAYDPDLRDAVLRQGKSLQELQ